MQNARLLYANRVLGDSSLNEQQKAKIAELVSGARSVEEAKMVYETLQKTMAGIEKEAPQPHVVVAFGLLTTNREPSRPSM